MSEWGIPSVGWTNLNKPARRMNPEYVVRAAILTQTSEKVHNIRSQIVDMAMQADMQPPLTARQVRLGTRASEIIGKLGEPAEVLIDEHNHYADINRGQMFLLRDEDYKTYSLLSEIVWPVPMATGKELRNTLAEAALAKGM